ncbi:MAG TPA: RNA 2',3'-cyclic phosphodiesterase [Methylomirabilota bacterium]|nr:RNA 2',3'-cyclic phosphodiesterase [Methylomirabilota bacterium]
MNESIRTFIAVAIPEAVKREVLAAQDRLRKQVGAEKKVRWSPPEQLHLTLRFLGNVPAGEIESLIAQVQQSAAEAEPFELQVSGVGCFPSFANPRVIWAGIHGDLPRLIELQKQIETRTAEVGEPPEKRDYKPHLTLGRVKAESLAELRHIGLTTREYKIPASSSWRVEEVEIIRSDLSPSGSTYTTLSHVRLG